MRRPPVFISVVVAGLVTVAAVSGASNAAGAADDPAAKRREVQRRRVAAAAEVDALRASSAKVREALDALNANARAAEARAANASALAAHATRAAESARVEEAAAVARFEQAKAELRNSAVRAYVNGPRPTPAATFSANPSEMARTQVLLDIVAGSASDRISRLAVARDDLTSRREAAFDAARSARARADAARTASAAATRARAERARTAAAVNTRLERKLAEASALESVDRQLAAEVTRREAELARRVPPSSARASRGGSSRPGPVRTRTVRGITVAEEIADELEAMLVAAQADGITFGGSGYRSSDAQVATRRANCGTSDYDVYEKPASECSPPTARPGQSMHERGLAIDFTYNGRALGGGSNPGYQWLKRNASRYGLYNLPGEPWHWSTNGN